MNLHSSGSGTSGLVVEVAGCVFRFGGERKN